MKEKVQDDKILLRLPQTLTSAIDQVLKEQLKESNRSEFIRRAIRYTLDNVEAFKTSSAATVAEKEEVESVAKINAIRDLYMQISKYKEIIQKEPQTANSIKQITFLIYLVSEMIYKMNEQ